MTLSARRSPSPSLRSLSGVVVGQVKFPGVLVVRSSPIHGTGLFARHSLPGRRKLGEISGRLVKLPQGRRVAGKLLQQTVYAVRIGIANLVRLCNEDVLLLRFSDSI